MIFLADLIKFFSFHHFLLSLSFYLSHLIFLELYWKPLWMHARRRPRVWLYNNEYNKNVVLINQTITDVWRFSIYRSQNVTSIFLFTKQREKQNSCETKIGWNSVYSKARNSSWKIEACNIWVNRIKNERIVPTVVANPALVLSP